MISISRTNVTRTQSAIADLRKKEAAEIKKEAALVGKISKATEAINKAKTASTLSNKLKELERAQNDQAKVVSARAAIAKKIAAKEKDLHRYQEALAKEEARERKKEHEALSKILADQEKRQKAVTDATNASIKELTNLEPQLPTQATMEEVYDVFISHASEDKDGFVKDFANDLRNRGLKVWYDEFELKWGARLRREIDRGLRLSRFGIVILSKHFFAKDWPQDELDGLHQLEMEGNSRILPIWHEISKDEVANFSPTMAGRLALNTSLQSRSEIADELEKLINSVN